MGTKYRRRFRDLVFGLLKSLAVMAAGFLILYAWSGGARVASADQPGAWSASYDLVNNCIDITAIPPSGQHVETTITWWDAANPNNMQTAVAGSSANPVTYTITPDMIQKQLGTGAPGTGNQYVIQCYYTQNGSTMAGYGGRATVTWGVNGSGSSQETAPVGGDTGQNTGSTGEQGSPMERFLAIPINAVANTIASLAGLMTLDQLIFGTGAFLSQSAWDTAMQWYQGLTLYAVLFMALVLLYLAWQASRAQDERERAEAYRGIWRWVFGFLMLYLVPWFATALFAVNGALVHFAGVQLHGLSVDNSVATGNVLSDAFIALYMAGLKLYFNILYVIRAVFVLLLLAVAPIVLWTYVLNPTRQSFIMWSAELFSNIMMQAAHALTLSFFFAILTTIQGSAAGSGVPGMLGQWWAKIVIITLVIPVGQFLRNLINMWLNVFGVPEEKLAGGAAAGIAGIMAVPKILGTMTGLKFGGVATGGAGSAGQAPSGGFNTPPDAGSGGTGGSPGSAASFGGFAAHYGTAAKVAAGLGGVMGTVVGMPLGQGRAFAEAGAAAGRRLVSNVGQAHYVLSQAGQEGASKPAAIGQAAGALLGGASGAHVAGTVMALGSRFLRGAPQDAANSGGPPAQGGSTMIQGGRQSNQPGVPTGATAGTGAQTLSAYVPSGASRSITSSGGPPAPGVKSNQSAGVTTPSVGARTQPISATKMDSGITQPASSSAQSSVTKKSDIQTGQMALPADRPAGLEDIIDFNRLGGGERR